MINFPLEHLEGCTPERPCPSCKAMFILREKLQPEALRSFLELARQAAGMPSEHVATLGDAKILSTDKWEPLIGEGLTLRTRNAMKNEGILTLGDIAARTKADFFKVSNFGRKSWRELVDVLTEKKLPLPKHNEKAGR